MSYPYFDYPTIGLYLIVGTLCMWSVKFAKGSRRYIPAHSVEGIASLFIILLLFAILRKVGTHLGGEDAFRYQEAFVNYYNYGAERFENTDILFGFFTGTIRLFTDSPIIYRLFCYGLISFGYVYFIKTLTPQGISSIPFICLLIPFMRSLNTMRNTMSIALFLLSIVALFNRRYFICTLFVCGSLFMHRLSFIMLSFFPFFFIFKKNIIKESKKKIIIIIGCLILLSYFAAVQLQKFIILFSLFADNGNSDMWYLTTNAGKNILYNWPMYIVHILLFIALMLRYNHLPDTRQLIFLKIIFFFDIVLLPATLVLGMWRFTEYFYISNLILWSVIITMLSQKLTINSAHLLKLGCLIGFYGLLYIRLTHEYKEAALMPYLFIWN